MPDQASHGVLNLRHVRPEQIAGGIRFYGERFYSGLGFLPGLGRDLLTLAMESPLDIADALLNLRQFGVCRVGHGNIGQRFQVDAVVLRQLGEDLRLSLGGAGGELMFRCEQDLNRPRGLYALGRQILFIGRHGRLIGFGDPAMRVRRSRVALRLGINLLLWLGRSGAGLLRPIGAPIARCLGSGSVIRKRLALRRRGLQTGKLGNNVLALRFPHRSGDGVRKAVGAVLGLSRI